MTLQKIIFTVAAATGFLFAASPSWAEEPKPATETNCSDRIDEDGLRNAGTWGGRSEPVVKSTQEAKATGFAPPFLYLYSA